MEITILKEHKSIKPHCQFEFPELVVLTGKNGSGKTHLLEALSSPSISKIIVKEKQFSKIRYIPFNGLVPNIVEQCNPAQITTYIKSVWTSFENIVKQNNNSYVQNSLRNKEAAYKNFYQQVTSNMSQPNQNKFVEKVLKVTDKSFDKITEDDFANNFDASDMGQSDFLIGQFALIFKNYHRKFIENKYNEFYESEGIETKKSFLTKEEFIEINGIPPWDFVNAIFKETRIPYSVNNPLGTRADSTFVFKLLDIDGKFEISSNDLSTGEKVLLSLALTIYNSTGEEGKPELLLLDEPDSALHPSMSKMLINSIKKHIVIKNGINVIITTHSPTTVICSEGISIYQLVRGFSIPTKIANQEAVELLSSDIPFLKISNDKRRQVFVESKYDVNYYEQLTNILANIDIIKTESIYIPARTSNGSNCEDVISIVEHLSKNGNTSVYGIIDWDSKNKSDNQILVLGEGERYSIENFLLDPLLIGIYLIRENKIKLEDFGITTIYNYSKLSELKIFEAQLIIDYVLKTLGFKLEKVVHYEVYNNWILKIDKEFCNYQGHNLEILYKEKFPSLKSHIREDSLKKDIIGKVINDFPMYTPKSIFDLIKNID